VLRRQIQLLSGLQNILVTLVEFLLNLHTFCVCILEQGGKSADALFIEFELSHNLVSLSEGFDFVFGLVISLCALKDRLHCNRVHLLLDLRQLLFQLVIFALHMLCKSAGCLLLLQVLIPLV